jgi:ACT domain-containing protein
MKTRYIRMNRLIPLLGIVLVAAGVVGVATYLDIEHKIHAGEALTATLNRLYHDQMASAVLRRIQDGDVAGAAQRLDLLLCNDILELNSTIASVDDRQRAYTQNVFVRMARTRPSNAVITASATREVFDAQIEAEKILALADAGNTPVNSGVAASH